MTFQDNALSFAPIDLSPEPVQGTIDLEIDKEYNPPLPEPVAFERASKASKAMGYQDSQSVLKDLQSGYEPQIRQEAAQKLDIEEDKLRRAMVMDYAKTKKGPMTPLETESIMAMSSDFLSTPEMRAKSSTIFETEYGHKVMNEVMARSDSGRSAFDGPGGDDFLGTVQPVASELGAAVIARREVLNKVGQDWGALNADSGWFGKAVDLAKTFIPLNTYVTLRSELGTDMMTFVEGLWNDPDHEAAALRYKTTLDSLGRRNSVHAAKLAEAVMGYSQAEQFVDQVFNLLDLIFAGQLVKGTAKLGLKGVRALGAAKIDKEATSTAREIVDSLSGAPKASESPSVGAASGATADAGPTKATWANKDFDIPVDVLPEKPSYGPDGRLYQKVRSEGKDSYVPLDELKFASKTSTSTPFPGHAASDNPAVQGVNVYRATTEAAIAPGATKPEAIALATGQGDTAGAILSRKIGEAAEWGANDPAGHGLALIETRPMILNPMKYLGEYADLATERANRILTALTRNSIDILKAITEPLQVRRALDTVYTKVGFNEAKDWIAKTYRAPEDAILNIGNGLKYHGVLPSQNAANVGEVISAIGHTDGTLFESLEVARHFQQAYGLPDDLRAIKSAASSQFTEIKQAGAGYYIQVTKTVDEKSPAFRAALTIETTNKSPTSWFTTLTKAFRTPDEFLSKFQIENRNTATHVQQTIAKYTESVAKNIGGLRKDEFNRLETLLKDNNKMMDLDNPDKRGYFFKTIPEYEQAYIKRFGTMPNEKESIAYFSRVQLNDMEWVMRNLGIYRDKSILGVQRFQFQHADINDLGRAMAYDTPWFDGKIVDSIPFKEQHDAGIYIYDPMTRSGRFIDKRSATAADTAEIAAKQKEGYRVVQVSEPTSKPLKSATGVEADINFVLVKDAKTAPLDWDQLPYRPGGHVEYRQNWYVKQPGIRRVGEEGAQSHIYEKDNVAFAFDSEAEALQHTKSMEAARVMLKEKTPGLGAFVERNLGMTEAKFASLFHDSMDTAGKVVPAQFHLDDAFRAVPKGKNVLDAYPNIGAEYTNFQNSVRSPYNLYAQQVDKKFAGARDGPLYTLQADKDELGVRFNRIYAENIDPFESISSSMSNVIKHRNFQDYKTGALEHWIQEFHDLLRVSGETQEQTLARLRENPVFFLHNPGFDTSTIDRARLGVAQAQQKAIINFLGTESELGKELNSFTNRLMNLTYEIAGQKGTTYIAEHSIPLLTDPASYVRAIGFHTKLGLFNPVQALLQAQTMTHILALSPTNAIPAFTSAMLMRKLALTNNESIINHLASMSETTGGLTKAQFLDSYKNLRKSGLYHVEGEVGNMDDVMGVRNLFQGAGKTFLDKGAMFFQEGERAVRLTAWNAAYREWAKLNPGMLLDNASAATVLARSNLMGMNMTRASNAAWQQGVWSIPTQFMSYQVRMAEQFFGNRLTAAEKMRMVVTNSAIYGVPIGVGATLGAGALPYYDDIRQAAIRRGLPLSEGWLSAVMNGLPQALMEMAGGPSVNFAQRYGPAGNSTIQDLFTGKKSPLEVVGGPSGSILWSIMKSAHPVVTSLYEVGHTGARSNAAWQVLGMDVMDALREVSTINNTVAGTVAALTGKLYSKNETYLSDVTKSEAVMKAAFGLSTMEQTDSFLKGDIYKNVTGAQKALFPAYMKAMERAIAAGVQGDHEQMSLHKDRAAAVMDSASLTPQEKQQWSRQMLSTNGPMIDKIDPKIVSMEQKYLKERQDQLLLKQKRKREER